jgi:hypothetical protein
MALARATVGGAGRLAEEAEESMRKHAREIKNPFLQGTGKAMFEVVNDPYAKFFDGLIRGFYAVDKAQEELGKVGGVGKLVRNLVDGFGAVANAAEKVTDVAKKMYDALNPGRFASGAALGTLEEYSQKMKRLYSYSDGTTGKGASMGDAEDAKRSVTNRIGAALNIPGFGANAKATPQPTVVDKAIEKHTKDTAEQVRLMSEALKNSKAAAPAITLVELN